MAQQIKPFYVSQSAVFEFLSVLTCSRGYGKYWKYCIKEYFQAKTMNILNNYGQMVKPSSNIYIFVNKGSTF